MAYAIYPVLQGLGWGLKKAPAWSVDISKTAAGNEFRTVFQQNPIVEFDLSYAYLSLSDKLTLEGFFNQQQGPFTPFYFDAQNDDTVSGFGVGTGDGTTTTFTIYKPAGTGAVEPVQGFNGFNLYKSDWQGNQLQYPTPRTNLFTHSQDITNWGNNVGMGVSNGGTFLSGSGTWVEATEDTSTTQHGIYSENMSGNFAPSTKYTVTLFFEQGASLNTQWKVYFGAGTGPVFNSSNYIEFNTSTKQIVGSDIFTNVSMTQLSSNSFKITGTIQTLSTATGQATLYVTAAAAYTGKSVVSFYCALQVEESSVATSYILTTASPVTVTDYSLSGNQVTFSIAPESGAVITWSGSYYYLVRFLDDTLELNQLANLMYECQKLRLIQVW